MKILIVSMPSIHVLRWIKNLENTNHELYWFDVLGRGKLKTNESIEQFTNWQKRKIPYIKGEYFLSKKVPGIFNRLEKFVKVTPSEALHEIITKIQPDILHSFEMQSCSYPLLSTMKKFPKLKWIYSCWGSDLYFYQNSKFHKNLIVKTLNRVNYLQTDNYRDFHLAKKLGFQGGFAGVIPGGGGYDLKSNSKYFKAPSDRKIILVKGYQHKFGRALVILKALKDIQEDLNDYEIVVLGAHREIFDFLNNHQLPFKALGRHSLSNEEVIKLMGESVIYIGNSISDGIPNSLLESIMMGAFPIQSNPGSVSEEVIEDGINGFLIKNPYNVTEIASLVLNAIKNKDMLTKASTINQNLAKEKIDFRINQKKILQLYELVRERNA